eukprot:2877984-Prymnesium_polylepis.1
MGAEYSACSLGTDCTDCTTRYVTLPPPSPSPPPPAPPDNDMCTNTCTWASDGYCDDGGPGAEYTLCPLGFDCYDCGRRSIITITSHRPPPPPPSPSPPPPLSDPPSPAPPQCELPLDLVL